MINFFKWIGNVLFRMVFGAIGIFTCNALLNALSQNLMVGINPETMLLIGLLGAPGFVALYGIEILLKNN